MHRRDVSARLPAGANIRLVGCNDDQIASPAHGLHRRADTWEDDKFFKPDWRKRSAIANDVTPDDPDPPPAKWSDLMYVF